jgi:hypothetical protein
MVLLPLKRGRSFGIRYHRHVSTSPLLDAAQLAPAVRTQCLRLLARP